MLLDAHNHLHQLHEPEAILLEMMAAGVAGCVVNGTSERDWPDVAALAERHPYFVRPAFGLHPWHAHQRSPHWLERLGSMLDRFPNASIGECGVDQWVDTPSIEVQLSVFLPQLKLARERELPITVHTLRAWAPLLDALEQEPPPDRGFLLHSFGGSPELVTRLARLGARFSFSGHFLRPRKVRTLDAFRLVPPDRLLLETDAPSMQPPPDFVTHPLPDHQNHPANLAAIARGLAQRFQEPVESLVDRCTANTRRFFKWETNA